MTTLFSIPVASILDRFFSEEECRTAPPLADLPDDERARTNLAATGLLDLVDLRAGDALETLAHDLPAQVDLLLLDGAKSLYCEILDLVEARLHAGSLIVADNADMAPDYLARIRADDGGYLSVAFAEDVELSLRLR